MDTMLWAGFFESCVPLHDVVTISTIKLTHNLTFRCFSSLLPVTYDLVFLFDFAFVLFPDWFRSV